MVILYAGLIGLTVLNSLARRQASFRSRIRAISSTSSNCRLVPARAHRRGGAARQQDGSGHARRRPHRAHRRPRRRHLHQRPERGGDPQPSCRLRRARQGWADRDEGEHAAQSEIPDRAGGFGLERVAAASPRHRHHRRLQARDPGHAWRRPHPARGRGAIGRGCRQSDTGSHQHLYHVQHPHAEGLGWISTASAPRCWASGPTTYSPRSKSISARNTSTTSTSSAAPTA